MRAKKGEATEFGYLGIYRDKPQMCQTYKGSERGFEAFKGKEIRGAAVEVMWDFGI